MEVCKSILKTQGRSLRLALEASVAEMKGHTATFSLERQAGSQLLLHKDQSRPERWRAQWPQRTHLGPSRGKLCTRPLTARRPGPRGPRQVNGAGGGSCSTPCFQKGSVQLGREAPTAGFPRAHSQSRAASAVRAPCARP